MAQVKKKKKKDFAGVICNAKEREVGLSELFTIGRFVL